MRSVYIIVCILILESAAVSDQCLRAICEVSSNGCQQNSCNVGGCGYFHISLDYYRKCGNPGPGWVACSNNRNCSERCVRSYLSLYGIHCTGGRYPVCQDYARIHFGGPRGCHRSGTLSDWRKVQRKLVGR